MKSNLIRIKTEHKRRLWDFKLDNECKNFSDAIALAIEQAEGADHED